MQIPWLYLSYLTLLLDQTHSFEHVSLTSKRLISRRIYALHDTTSTLSTVDEESSLPLHHCLNNVDRVFCLSDLHTDHVDNLKWLREKMDEHHWTKRDLLIVAGDISHDMDVFRRSMRYMQDRCHVFFICGNHEAWLNKQDEFDSLEKMEQVYDECRTLGVMVDPCLVNGRQSLLVLPIQSWYDGSLCFSNDLSKGFRHWPWVDFLRCRWRNSPPSEIESTARIPIGLTEHLLERNTRQFTLIDEYSSAALMTVSHFLPNKQSLPDWIDLEQDDFSLDWLDHGAGDMSAKFAKVAGSELIGQQLRSLPIAGRRHMHIFGHSHRPKDFDFDGVRYIHNPLGKPRERQLHMVNPQVDFQLVWDTRRGEVKGEQVLRYWDEKGGGREALQKRLQDVKPGRYQRER
ncbi:hypothetical protein MPSEU_000706100 [Mayamaea pseudoterrestris]|nr:hypothetical protein MPSEU_000706100 [Mayamaea pseudoterrestris]